MNIMIDGRPIVFEGRPTLLEVAQANGIFIPSLCDYPGLEPYGACRLCLVEVKGRKGYVPACSTMADEGLEVRTATPELAGLRRGILELILAEHPNACLICDEKKSCDEYKSTIRKTGEVTGCVLCLANGRCELQRVVEAIGLDRVHFSSLRREGEVRRDDPFIDRDNSLCILCGRCVRVCRDMRGASVLTFVSRGSMTVIGTAMNRRLLESGCRFCGACVDVCPTGSLAERSVRYERLPETEKQTICPFCGQGCGLKIGLRDGRVLGSVPDPEGAVNRGQACVKGRFLVKSALYHPRRLLRPMVRKDGRLRESTWEEALDTAAQRLSAFGAGEIAVAGSAQSSCEDLFVLHRFAAEVLKAPNVIGSWAGSPTAVLRELAASAAKSMPLNFRLADIGGAGAIIQFGEDLPATQPILGLEVHRAVRNGTSLVTVGVGAGRPGGWASLRIEIPEGAEETFPAALLAVMLKDSRAKSVKAEGFADLEASFKKFNIAAALRAVRVPREKLLETARLLMTRRPVFLLFGREFLGTGGRRQGLLHLWNLAVLTAGRVIPLDGEANIRGGLEIVGAFSGALAAGEKAAASAARREIRALYLNGPFPKLEPAAELVIVQGSYEDENTAKADIVFPETTSFESDGTFANIEGRAQLSKKAAEPLGEAKPGWLILSELAAKMGHTGFGYSSAEGIRKDLARNAPAFRGLSSPSVPPEGVFLDEEPAGSGAFIGGTAASGREARTRPAVFRNPDDYKGLNMALETKSLKLVRGR